MEACWAHNPEVRGSKPRSAKPFSQCPLLVAKARQLLRLLVTRDHHGMAPAPSFAGRPVRDAIGSISKVAYELARIRTWNLLIRSQTRYPLRHEPSRHYEVASSKVGGQQWHVLSSPCVACPRARRSGTCASVLQAASLKDPDVRSRNQNMPSMENRGIDPRTSRMLSERSTI